MRHELLDNHRQFDGSVGSIFPELSNYSCLLLTEPTTFRKENEEKEEEKARYVVANKHVNLYLGCRPQS